jgi:hypothetical protein
VSDHQTFCVITSVIRGVGKIQALGRLSTEKLAEIDLALKAVLSLK